MNKEKSELYRKVNTKTQRGLDYTPLFKFLLSKVGKKWDAIFKEAISRLPKEEPIYWLVALSEEEKRDFVRVGESTYYSGLFVDENGVLQKCNPNLDASTMTPFCGCCTHTFNGEVFGKKYEE